MKEAYWGYWLVILGVFIIVIMLLIQNVTSNNTEDYYTIRQISEAAMIDAVDYAYYREYGEVKINKEKFIENFARRFAESASATTDYKVLFTGIYEAPPKVSVEITSKTEKYIINTDTDPNNNDGTSFDISNRIDAILELGGANNQIDNSQSNNSNNNNDSNNQNSTENNQDSNQNNSRVPSVTDLGGVSWYNWYQINYLDCLEGTTGSGACMGRTKLKDKYKNDSNLYFNDLLRDWQTNKNIQFTDAEKEEFLENAREALKLW